MLRTISIKLNTTYEQNLVLLQLQKQFNDACNSIVPIAIENRCWNRVALHHLAYYKIRKTTALGSQMVCNAIRAVCESFKALNIKKTDSVPVINFKPHSSIHFDKRTYSLKKAALSLYT